MNALVVDDNVDAAELLAYRMRARGMETLTVGSVREAVAALASCKVDLVLTDYCMPEEDGLVLVKFCARTRATLPVVIVTGWGRDDVADDALDAGAFDLIEKPVTDHELDRVIARLQ